MIWGARRGWLVFDTETTGLGPASHLVEIGAVLLTPDLHLLVTFESLVRPPIAIPREATRIHGISDKDVASAPGARDVVASFLWLATRARLVAHNAPFDSSVLASEIGRGGLNGEVGEIVDTLRLARRAFPHERSFSLGALRRSLRLDSVEGDRPACVGRAHCALPDAVATAELLRRIVERVGEIS